MAAPEPIDLHHLGRERVIASYLLDTDDGPALVDCGPSTTIDALKAGLADRGIALSDIRHLLLSHIHLDHAGATGVLVREHPALQVHVSPIGAPHLLDPARLERSARRLYGDSFDSLWGELAPVPQQNVHPLEGPVLGLETFPTPGMPLTTSASSIPTGRSTPATRAVSESCPAVSSCRRRRRPRSTSRRGRTRSTRSSGGLPNGSRSSTSASPTTSAAISPSCG